MPNNAETLKTNELNFFGSDPGAVKYGNFINYYSFHSAQYRINNLNPLMLPSPLYGDPVICLDVGCNTGELTKEINSYLRRNYPGCNIYILGIDIDPSLIERAMASNNDSNISFQVLNVMNEKDREIVKNYLTSFRRNIFDITFCFSVTMWIHINNGDDKLLEFLQYLKDISNTIIIEPQPWNCYRNAQRRVKKSGSMFPLYETLKLRSNIDSIIEEVLEKNTHKKVYESPSSPWNRKIQSYHKK